MRLAIIPLLALSVLACDSPDGQPSTRPAEWVFDDAPVLSMGRPFEDGPEFDRITSAVLLSGDSIAVADASLQVWILAPDGTHVRTLGGKGMGPGEFVSVAWVDEMSPDSLLVFDQALNRLSVFTRGGTFVRSVDPQPRPGSQRPPSLMGVFADGSLLAAERLLAPPPTGGSGRVRPELVLMRYASDGSVIDSLTTTPGNEFGIVDGVIVSSPVLKRTTFALGAGRFFVTTGERFRALSFDREGHVVDTLESPRPRTPLSPQVMDALGVQGPEADILPDSVPATTDVLIDPDGRVWLGRADAVPVDPGPWFVFATNGTIIARVRMPDGFRPTAIGEAAVLGVWTDDLGVESLRLYRLPVPEE